MTRRTRPLVFRRESDLEDYLEVHLASLLSLLGLDLLIIDRQVRRAARRRIDLLAIDTTGVIHIIELKYKEASPEVIAQVLHYLHWIKLLNREEIIRLAADGVLGIDLPDAFQRHFGHPLPETANEAQALMIIGASIHPRTASSVLELRDGGYAITAFRYVVQSDTVSLIPCCRDDRDMEMSGSETRPSPPRRRSTAKRTVPSPTFRTHIDLNIRWFWLSHEHRFNATIVTFAVIYMTYTRWLREQVAEGLELDHRTWGQFSRQLLAIIAESDGWTHVFIPPGCKTDAQGTLLNPPSVSSRRDAEHRISAYQRNAVNRAP